MLSDKIDESLLADTALAQWVYTQLELHRDQNVGPFIKVENYNKEIFELVLGGWGKISNDNQDGPIEGKNIVEVKSPWHAALLLEEINQNFLSRKERLIFRGQSDTTWDIVSSIDRINENDQLIASVKSKVFADILGALSFNSLSTANLQYQPDNSENQNSLIPKLRITPSTYIAAAQHYNIPTNLIDWTTDPGVATFFAALDAKKSSSKTASIFVLNVQKVIQGKYEILVSPPFVERLHLQRGFFIRADKNESLISLKDLCCIEIRFPTDFYFEEFKVIRRGSGIVNLLPENQIFEELKVIVNNIAKSMLQEVEGNLSYKLMSPIEYSNLMLHSSAQIKAHFNSLYQNYNKFWDDYLLKFEDILFWTCYKELGEDIHLDEQIYRKILDDNHDLAYSVITMWKEYLAEQNSHLEKKRLNRIKLFVQAAEEFINNFQGFKSVTIQEAFWEIHKNGD